MDPKALLQMAVERMNAEQASQALEALPVLFTVQRQDYRWTADRGLVSGAGGTMSTAIGSTKRAMIAAATKCGTGAAFHGHFAEVFLQRTIKAV